MTRRGLIHRKTKQSTNKEKTPGDFQKLAVAQILVKKLPANVGWLVGWLVGWFGFYGISTFVGYLTPNPFFFFFTNKQFYFKQFCLA